MVFLVQSRKRSKGQEAWSEDLDSGALYILAFEGIRKDPSLAQFVKYYRTSVPAQDIRNGICVQYLETLDLYDRPDENVRHCLNFPASTIKSTCPNSPAQHLISPCSHKRVSE